MPRSLTSRGIPSSLRVRATKLQPYFWTNGIRSSKLCGWAEIELRIHLSGVLEAFKPASIATVLVVSSAKGRSETSSTVLTSQAIISSPALRAGPRFKSWMSPPASSCSIAIFWIGLGSRSLIAGPMVLDMMLILSGMVRIDAISSSASLRYY